MNSDFGQAGEPEKIASDNAVLDEWELVMYGRAYRVMVAAPLTSEDVGYVMIDVPSDSVGDLGGREVRTWVKMRGSKTGGVITPDFVESRFRVDPQTAERVALLIASALGRPLAVRYSEAQPATPD